MLDARSHTRRALLLLFVGLLPVASVRGASAACNEPPDPATRIAGAYQAGAYSGASGTISSPFLIPGRLAGDNTWRTTTISANSGSTHGPVTGDVLTVAIRDSSPQVAAVFAANCNGVAACNPAVPCHTINSLSFGTSPASVTFETSDVLEELTRTGPVRLAVTPAANVPCTLSAVACSSVSATMHACIDDVTLAAGANYDIGSVTALPEPNDFSKFCKGGGCGKVKGSIRYTLDRRGDMLVPFDWSKLIKKLGGGSCKEGDSCDLHKVFAGTNLPSGITAKPIIDIPCTESETYLQSFSAAGTSFSPGPLFQVEPLVGILTETRLLGTIDKAFSVLRIRRCPQADASCTDPRFTLSLGTADYLEILVPAGKTGTCSDGVSECSSTDPCPSGQKCTWFDGRDLGPVTGPLAPSCTPVDDEGTGSGVWVIIAIIVGGVLLLILVFRKK